MKDLETKNLRIRKFKIEDAKDVYENLATEKKLADSLDYNVHRNIEETKRVMMQTNKSDKCYVYFDKYGVPTINNVNITKTYNNINFTPTNPWPC